MTADTVPRQFGKRGPRDNRMRSAQAQRVGVVKNDDLVIGGKAQVALDPRPVFKRRSKGDETVLDEGRTVMEPAMREPGRPRIERISRGS